MSSDVRKKTQKVKKFLLVLWTNIVRKEIVKSTCPFDTLYYQQAKFSKVLKPFLLCNWVIHYKIKLMHLLQSSNKSSVSLSNVGNHSYSFKRNICKQLGNDIDICSRKLKFTRNVHGLHICIRYLNSPNIKGKFT